MLYKITILILLYTALSSSIEIPEKCSDLPSDICGLNAKCYDKPSDSDYYKYGEPYCKCNEGIGGRPPNCQGCTKDAGCKEDEYCSRFDSKCKKGCANDEKCNSDEFCNTEHTCEKGCRINGCERGQKCDEYIRQCVDCSRDYDCEDESDYCDFKDNKCKKGCRSYSSCNDDEYCNETTRNCEKICEAYPCGSDSVCFAKYGSKTCSCVEGFAPKQEEGCIQSDTVESNCENSCGQYSNCVKNETAIYCTCLGDYISDPFSQCIVLGAAYLPPATIPPMKPGSDDSISCAAIACLAG